MIILLSRSETIWAAVLQRSISISSSPSPRRPPELLWSFCLIEIYPYRTPSKRSNYFGLTSIQASLNLFQAVATTITQSPALTPPSLQEMTQTKRKHKLRARKLNNPLPLGAPD
ncbi:hypothetical protein PGT21_011929 [Puccinia graminis f. sp. tritici]|uniref:Uncharacterized protein n=1 Tax=Puccinia graminis f. sp. tritici TaxID=56615 RepID=A0A5B0LPT7_PUCGR|nr:hypothetical protein PGT21_011929 [Puccinia graminis f. sp. tritici]KAA1070899.1 hypothetical protein PGTUg99_009477 [Puccinia graminis f. sp. tritici]